AHRNLARPRQHGRARDELPVAPAVLASRGEDADPRAPSPAIWRTGRLSSPVGLRRQLLLVPERPLGSEHGDDTFGGVQLVDPVEPVKLVGPLSASWLRTDYARRDAGDVDLGPAALFYQRLGQPRERGERARIREYGLTLGKAAGRRDVGDQAIAATLAQQRHCSASHAHHGQRAHVSAPRRVDQHVDAAEARVDFLDEDLDSALGTSVAEAREGTQLLGRAGQRNAVPVTQDQLGTAVGESLRTGKAGAASGTGNEHARLVITFRKSHRIRLAAGWEQKDAAHRSSGPPAADRTFSLDMWRCTF